VGFGWSTRDELMSATAFGLLLVDPALVVAHRGDETNLVVALRTGVSPYPRMPLGGPYVSENQIEEIADWINQGAQG
jgi:hypothetical protein